MEVRLRRIEKLSNIPVNEAIVRKKLDKLRPDKAAGADDLSPRVLYELKDEICYPVMMIMKASHLRWCLRTGKQSTFHRFLKRVGL